MEAHVDADLDTLATALYVSIDDLLKDNPQLGRGGQRSGSRRRSPTPSWSPSAVMQALLGFTTRPAGSATPRPSAADVPVPAAQPGYNKRLRAAGRQDGLR